MSRSFRSLVILSAVLALVLAWPAESLFAQSTAGSISGTVTGRRRRRPSRARA